MYSSYDQEAGALIDVYWIRSIDDIYKIGALALSVPIIGREVEAFKRNGSELRLESYEKERVFHELPEAGALLRDNFVEQDELSLSSLFKLAPSALSCDSEKECGVMTSLTLRLLYPWFNVLAVIGPLPFLVRNRRGQPLFLLFGLSLFGLTFVFLLIEAAATLSKRQTLPPLATILVPFLMIFLTILTRYFSLK